MAARGLIDQRRADPLVPLAQIGRFSGHNPVVGAELGSQAIVLKIVQERSRKDVKANSSCRR